MVSLQNRLQRSSCPEPNTGCVLWMRSTGSFGHGSIREGGAGSGLLKTHRAAWELAHGPIPDGMCVLHKCDTPACINVDHLFLGTREANVRDMVSKGRQARRDRHSQAKITTEIATAIRESDLTQNLLAAQYGLNQSTISNIVTGRTWGVP